MVVHEYTLRSDRELALLSKQGNKDALGALYSRYQKPMAKFLASFLWNNPHEIELVYQDTFIRIMGALDTFDCENFQGWIFRIGRNTALNRVRYLGYRNHFSENDVLPDQEGLTWGNTFISRDPIPEEELLDLEKRVEVRNALEELSENHRKILYLREFDNLSYQEIAEKLGVEKGTVMSRINRAKKRLEGQLMSQDYDFFEDGETKVFDPELLLDIQGLNRDQIGYLRTLKLRDQEIFYLREVRGFTYRRIARKFGLKSSEAIGKKYNLIKEDLEQA